MTHYFLPDNRCSFDIGLLPPLGATPKQNHDALALNSKVHSVARADIESQFVNSTADAPDVGPTTLRKPSEGGGQSRCDDSIKIIEPVAKRALARLPHVLDDLERAQWFHLRYH
jgi:hypothetical protein